MTNNDRLSWKNMTTKKRIKKKKKNQVYLKGVKQHFVVHLDQPRDTRHLCIWHGVKYYVVDTEKWHQHQCGLQ